MTTAETPETQLERAEREQRERDEQLEKRELGIDDATQARKLEQADLGWLMGSKKGRRILWRMLEQNHLLQHTTLPGTPLEKVHGVDHRRAWALLLLSKLKECSADNVPTMLKENWVDGSQDG